MPAADFAHGIETYDICVFVRPRFLSLLTSRLKQELAQRDAKGIFRVEIGQLVAHGLLQVHPAAAEGARCPIHSFPKFLPIWPFLHLLFHWQDTALPLVSISTEWAYPANHRRRHRVSRLGNCREQREHNFCDLSGTIKTDAGH